MTASDLPIDPQRLHLNFRVSDAGLASFQAGYELQAPEDRWSWRFAAPWIQVWRPTFDGLYCYAVRFEKTGLDENAVAEAWVRGDLVGGPLGADLSRPLKFILECFGGYDSDERLVSRLDAHHSQIGLSFSGLVRTEQDVDDVAEALKKRLRASSPPPVVD